MKPQNIIFGIFAVLGTLFLVLDLYFTIQSVRKDGAWEETSGKIVDLDNSGFPTVVFEYEGISRKFHSSFSSSDMISGQDVKVYFPKGEPDKAEIKSFFTSWFLPLFFGLFTLVFGGVGFIGLWVTSKPNRMKHELVVLGKGRKVTIPIGEVTQNFSFKVNGRSPFIIIGQWHDKTSNTVYQFKSESIWYNPLPYMEEKKEVDVYIDPNDMKRYYVDISFLPKKG